MKKIDLTRLYERFVSLIKKYIADKGLMQHELAEMVDMNQPNINALLNKKRPLTAYYLFKFIRRGIICVDEIYDEKAENDREKEFWAIAKESENVAMLRKIADLRADGIDIDNIIDNLHKTMIKRNLI